MGASRKHGPPLVGIAPWRAAATAEGMGPQQTAPPKSANIAKILASTIAECGEDDPCVEMLRKRLQEAKDAEDAAQPPGAKIAQASALLQKKVKELAKHKAEGLKLDADIANLSQKRDEVAEHVTRLDGEIAKLRSEIATTTESDVGLGMDPAQLQGALVALHGIMSASALDPAVRTGMEVQLHLIERLGGLVVNTTPTPPPPSLPSLGVGGGSLGPAPSAASQEPHGGVARGGVVPAGGEGEEGDTEMWSEALHGLPIEDRRALAEALLSEGDVETEGGKEAKEAKRKAGNLVLSKASKFRCKKKTSS